MKNQLNDPHAFQLTNRGAFSGSWGSKFSKINHIYLTEKTGKITPSSLARINAVIASGNFTTEITGVGTMKITRKYPWENGEWGTLEID